MAFFVCFCVLLRILDLISLLEIDLSTFFYNFYSNFLLTLPLNFKNKQTTIYNDCDLAKADFEKIKENLEVKNINSEEFKIFANGLF